MKLYPEGHAFDERINTQMTKYNTNLASEFYVLSMLHRLGADASLTLGNKKAVDIIVVNEKGTMITVDVKGVAGRYDWPADNIHTFQDPNHFYVFMSFEGKIADPQSTPSVWIIPSTELAPFIHKFKTRTDISRVQVREKGEQYRDAWHLIAGSRDI